MNTRYIYWHQNLRSAEPQQVLFAMVLNSPYVRQPRGLNMNMLEIPQGSLVTPREPIAIGRMKAHPGQTFWVCCPAYIRPVHGYIRLARSGQNSGNAKAYALADFERFFTPVSTF